jgi:hypothetical protein
VRGSLDWTTRGRPARGFINRVMREIGPISDVAPAFPLAGGALAPLRAKAEAHDGIHMDDDLILVAAIGVDAKGDKHPLGLAEGATENAATVQAARAALENRPDRASHWMNSLSASARLLTHAVWGPSTPLHLSMRKNCSDTRDQLYMEECGDNYPRITLSRILIAAAIANSGVALPWVS